MSQYPSNANEFFSWDSHENYTPCSSEFFHGDSGSADDGYGETGNETVLPGRHHSVSYSKLFQPSIKCSKLTMDARTILICYVLILPLTDRSLQPLEN